MYLEISPKVHMGKGGSKLSQQEIERYTSTLNFSKEELSNWYRLFNKDCPSGYVTKEEFVSIYRSSYPLGNAAQFAEYVFSLFDQNNDNKLDFEEFMTVLSITAKGTIEDKLRWSFRLYDLDNDGFINREEMLKIVTAIYDMIGNQILFAPENFTPDTRVEHIFSKMDGDHDGKISWDDFKTAAEKDDDILQLLELPPLSSGSKNR